MDPERKNDVSYVWVNFHHKICCSKYDFRSISPFYLIFALTVIFIFIFIFISKMPQPAGPARSFFSFGPLKPVLYFIFPSLIEDSTVNLSCVYLGLNLM